MMYVLKKTESSSDSLILLPNVLMGDARLVFSSTIILALSLFFIFFFFEQ